MGSRKERSPLVRPSVPEERWDFEHTSIVFDVNQHNWMNYSLLLEREIEDLKGQIQELHQLVNEKNHRIDHLSKLVQEL